MTLISMKQKNIVKNVCVVTGSRAEYGLLRPLLRRIRERLDMRLRLVVTGMHLRAEFGNTICEIEDDGFAVDARLDTLMSSDAPAGTVKSVGLGMLAFADYFSAKKPDILIVLGDRFEIFAAASAAAIMRVPVAHICGGDVSEGAADEFFRHSITKMSALHFPSNDVSMRRLIRMGESPDRVYNVGALNVECIRSASLLTPTRLESDLGISLDAPYALATYHPETLTGAPPTAGLTAMLDALGQFKDIQFIFTKANADSGGREINDALERRCERTESFRLFTSLGSLRYLSLMRGAKAVVGNSSSGLYETPVFGVPAVNIGDRQKGRHCPDNVINCKPVYDDIVIAVKKALTDEFAQFAKTVRNPYGDGDTSRQIAKRVAEFLRRERNDAAKAFYDGPL